MRYTMIYIAQIYSKIWKSRTRVKFLNLYYIVYRYRKKRKKNFMNNSDK